MARHFYRIVSLWATLLLLSPAVQGEERTLPFLFGDGTLPFRMTGRVGPQAISASFSTLNLMATQPDSELMTFSSHCSLGMSYYRVQSHGIQGYIRYQGQQYNVKGICFDIRNPQSPRQKYREIIAAHHHSVLRLRGHLSNNSNYQTFSGTISGTGNGFSFSYIIR